jgi:alkylresorcinol/alkylpyrone synthase
MIISVELPSLTFQPTDRSPTNVISCALFGDGAAAVVLSGEPVDAAPRIVHTASHRFENSLDWMGFNLKDSGLHIVLSPKVPVRVRQQTRPLVESFLGECSLGLGDIDYFLLHPGGRKIIEAYEETLELAPHALDTSREIMRDCGNLSSATVLFILEAFLRDRMSTAPRAGQRGLLMAFGPGFSAEMLLLKW